jgi:hypothetical protein
MFACSFRTRPFIPVFNHSSCSKAQWLWSTRFEIVTKLCLSTATATNLNCRGGDVWLCKQPRKWLAMATNVIRGESAQCAAMMLKEDSEYLLTSAKANGDSSHALLTLWLICHRVIKPVSLKTSLHDPAG